MRKLMILFYCMLTLLTVSSIQAQTPNYNIRVFGYLNTWALQMGAGVWGSSNYENMLYTNLDRGACTDYITFNDNKISLRDYLDMKVNLIKELSDLQFKLNQTAVDKAESLMRHKIDSMNEWRNQNKDERAMFATKLEVAFLTKMVYTGVGIVVAVEFFLKYIK